MKKIREMDKQLKKNVFLQVKNYVQCKVMYSVEIQAKKGFE